MKIIDVILTKSYTGFFFDDQKAIKIGADSDGFMYVGEPATPGFSQIRVPGEAISIQLVLDNGFVAYGDCAAVQYSGAGGRDPLFLADDYIPFIETYLKPQLLKEEITTFKELANKYDHMLVEGRPMHTAIRYGITQALLHAVAIKNKLSLAEVIRNEYNPNNRVLKRVPIFAQSGDNRYSNVDKMILKEVDAMPHALINNIKEKLGLNGEILLDYIKWLSDRVIKYRKNPNYNPVFHVDVYGTIGIIFNNDTEAIVKYTKKLAEAAAPFHLRLEGPVDTGDREGTMVALRDITKRVDEEKISVEIVADEWCNTFEDIVYFADNKAGHMLQIKTPDLGGINNTAEAIIYCKNAGIGAYCGGTCNETNISAQATTNIAIACEADQCLAKPGMGVDEGFMIVKNEMERVIALANSRK
ncbi:MAG TPA: methylaspartate ammonia-lyase [Bacilli bacterium]|nr:methylaspartate ammonia-lyase [Bacilli bacterium]